MSSQLYTYTGFEHLTYPQGHPFRPERALMMIDILKNESVFEQNDLSLVQAPEAGIDQLMNFHTSPYLSALEQGGKGEFDSEFLSYGIGTEDCPVFLGVYELACLSAGASLAAANEIIASKIQMAFNPIGGFHHAGPAFAEGFCYINDVVLATKRLKKAGLKVACLDLDAHHGNGTETAFLEDPQVLAISIHESGKTLYPWHGEPDQIGVKQGRGFNINLPMLAGSDDQVFNGLFDRVAIKAIEDFAPDVIVLEVGMDVLNGDPLTHLKMTNNSIARASEIIRNLGLPILALGGGGYHPENTARGWAVALMALLDHRTDDDFMATLGGTFLGSNELVGGLKDMQVYATGDQRIEVDSHMNQVIEFHQKNTLPKLENR